MSVLDPGPEQDDPRVIPVSKDEEQWPGLVEVGSEIIARGGLVVLPTDTLYGVGCDPFNASVVLSVETSARMVAATVGSTGT